MGSKLKLAAAVPMFVWDPKTKEIIWLIPSKNRKSLGSKTSLSKSHPLLSTDIHNKVDAKLALAVGIWFRALVYASGIKNISSYNLVNFEIEYEKGRSIVLYTLLDLGYKTPRVSKSKMKILF